MVASPRPFVFAPPAPPSTLRYPSLAGRRVLVASESLGPVNGVTRATTELLSYLHMHGIETAAVAPHLADGHEADTGGIPTVRLDGFNLPYNPELRVASPFRLRTVYSRAFPPDLVYLASPASLGLQLWWQARDSGVPFIANYQTDLAHYSRVMLPKPLGMIASAGVDHLTGYVFAHRSVRAVFYPSAASRDYLLGCGVPAAKLRLLRRGVDCRTFDRAHRDAALRHRLAPNGEIVLLCVSRLSMEKGFDFLAEAYARMVERAAATGAPRFRLVITGGNANPTIERTIQGYFTERGLDVHFTGMLTGDDLAAIYATADAFLFPSVTETFGQVVQEAMASGLPVVARCKGGPADLVQDGTTGYLPDPDDVDAFADAALRLVCSRDLRARFGLTARSLAETRSWDIVNHQIVKVMTEAIQS